MIRLVALLLVAGVLVGCAATVSGPERPRHVLGLGFESLVDGTDWTELSRRLIEAHVDEVSIAVGRLDWLAFPPDGVGRPSGPVRETGRDYVAEAIDGLVPWRRATPGHRITLTIDALIPGLISDDPSLAAVDAHGRPSREFASVTALEGSVGDDLAQLTEEVVRRYGIAEIGVTELLIDDSYGDDDLESYRGFSGAVDWPRAADGAIDTEHPSIAAWRSAVVADLAARMAERARALGAIFAVDVRVNWKDPPAGRPESGHDYTALLDRVDRLTLWCYTALARVQPESVGRLPGALAAAGLDTDRMIFSIGLWNAVGDDPVPPGELARGVRAAEASAAAATGVTPHSMLSPAHYDVLVEEWR